MASKFGQLLVWGKVITPKQLDHALEVQRTSGGKLGEILHQLGYITDAEVTKTLGIKYGVATVNLDNMNVDAVTLSMIPAEMARSRRVIPIARFDSNVTCAMEDPTRVDVIDGVEFQTGFNVQPVLATSAMMSRALDRFYPVAKPAAAPPQEPKGKSPAVAEIARLLEQLPAEKLEYVRRFVTSIQ